MSDVITIQPGSGSFTDASGNVYTINANDSDTAEINGQPITPDLGSTYTGALVLDNGSVYGQDEHSGQWYLMASKGSPGLWEWQPVSAPPDLSGSGDNFVLSGGSTPAATGSNQTNMTFVGGGSTGDTPAASGILSIQPGSGSFTDPSGNVFTINAAALDTAEINGQPITPDGGSTNTGVLELSNGTVYGQDEHSGQWYALASKGSPGLWEWQPVAAVPGSN